MSQYAVLVQTGADVFEREGVVEARTSQDALKKYLTGKDAPENPIVAVPTRHFQPVEIEVEQVAPRIKIKGQKKKAAKRTKKS